jgi:mannose-1-phosphate guanylyltransferase/phosphomannomutase
MTPLFNKPILEHNIRLLKHHGIKDLIMILFYQSEIITDYFKDGKKFGVKIEYIKPDADYGTAGAVYYANDIIEGKFIIISGDVVTDFDLNNSVSFHDEKNSAATIILTHSHNPLQFGIVLTDKDGRIVKFFEKPTWSEVFSDTINTGIYILEKETLELVPKARPAGKPETDFSKDLFPYLLKHNMNLFGYVNSGYWKDVGSLEDYITANTDILKGKVKLYHGERLTKNQSLIDKTVSVHTKDKENIQQSIINTKCRIGKNTRIKNSIIWDSVEIGNNVTINNAVLCSNVTVKDNVSISSNVFIGDEVIIGAGSVIKEDVKIWPKKIIDSGSIVHKNLIWEEHWKGSLFTDSRITGLSNIEVTPEFAAKLGQTFGVVIGKGETVAISRDMDKTSRMIKGALISGIMSSGVNVVDLQTVPVPILRQELKAGKGAGGIFVRKSPFDASKIDIIFFDSSGKDLSAARTKSIERLYFSGDYIPIKYFDIGSVSFSERTLDRYKAHFLSHIGREIINKRRFRIVINYSNGIASSIFPLILGNFNLELISLDTHIDPAKQTKSPDEFKEALKNLEFIVTSLNYDAGFLIDAGGEKVFLIDDKGKRIENDRFLTVMTKLFLKVNPYAKKIAVPIQASGEIEIIASEYGTEVVRVKDSHYAMMSATEDKDVAMIGGTKGGLIFPEFLFATDGMFTIVKILEMLASSNKSLSEIDNECPRLFMTKQNLTCTKEQKGRIMRMLVEESSEQKRQMIDGIKIFFGDSKWVLCIPDSEREIFHVNAEAKTKKAAYELKNKYAAKISKLQQNG